MNEDIENAIKEITYCYYSLGKKRKDDPNCYRHDIFKNRDLKNWKSPQYTWQWNFSINEYNWIKDLLHKHAAVINNVIRNDKICCKFLQLYVSEWYKREFNGHDGQGNAFDAIRIQNIARSIWEELFDNPNEMVYMSNIDENGNETGQREWLDSIYVDGGLPLKYLLSEQRGQRFTQSIRSLIEESFSGNNITDLGNLCDNGVINQSYLGRKLHPNENEASIFDFIQETIINEKLVVEGFEGFNYKIRQVKRQAEADQKHKRPFSFKWLFDFNDPNHTLDIRFEVTGPTTLPDEFIRNHQLDNAEFISISVKCNNNVLYRAEYDERGYSRRNVKYNNAYRVGDEITIEIEETGEVLLTHELDLSDPKLLAQTDEYSNTFTLCDSKKIAYSDCRAIAMKGWVSKDIENDVYSIDNEIYTVFFIKQTIDIIRIHNDETESKTFDPQRPLCWTIIDPRCVLRTQLSTKEPLYDAKKMQFIKGEENKVDRSSQRVKFAAKGSRVWNDRPTLGEIRARIDLGNESVDPVKFINVGELSISKEASSRDTCDVLIKWNGGNVDSTEAVFKDGIWHISKDQLNNIRFVPFTFTPNPENGEAFKIHICPLFDDFKILNPDLKEVTPNSVIPMVDLQTYRYYLHGNDINLRFGGNSEEQIQYRNSTEQNKINVKCRRDTDGHEGSLRSVPCEGFLSAFFGGTNTIRNLLERNTRPITEAIDKVDLYIGRNRGPETYYFKDFPYRIIQDKENCLSVSNCITHVNKDINYSLTLPPYNGSLLSIPVDNPFVSPITLCKSDSATYIIPHEMLESENKQWLVYGDKQGLILPKLIDLDKSLNNEERSLLRKDNIIRIKQELKVASLFDNKWETAIRWFELVPEGRIPASSMLTMVAIADDPVLLKKLALHLFIKNYESPDDVARNLNEFQRQMQFLWSWVPTIDLTGFINFEASSMMSYYSDWQENSYDIIDSEKQTQDKLNECKAALIQSFNQWFFLLQYDNEPIQNPHPLYTDPMLNAFGNGLQSEEARYFFKDIRTPGNPTPRERWILERRNAHQDIIDGTRNAWELGDYSPEVTKEIHRSIIYGLKFEYNEQ